jgi:hypothetical protein
VIEAIQECELSEADGGASASAAFASGLASRSRRLFARFNRKLSVSARRVHGDVFMFRSKP